MKTLSTSWITIYTVWQRHTIKALLRHAQDVCRYYRINRVARLFSRMVYLCNVVLSHGAQHDSLSMFSWATSSAPETTLRLAFQDHPQAGCRRVELMEEVLLTQLQGHSGRVSSIEFSIDNRRILSEAHDKTIHVWDAKTGMDIFARNTPSGCWQDGLEDLAKESILLG